jgi:GAF domain-containing protein
VKTERVTLLTTPEFKAFLAEEARREQVSVAELVRSRCERRPSDDEAVLAALSEQLQVAVAQARRSLQDGLIEAQQVLAALPARPADTDATASRTKARARKGTRRTGAAA